MSIQSLPGFREFYPEMCAKKNHLMRVFRQVVALYGFQEYEAPILEPLELFTQKSGPEIVQQLFAFEDKGGRQVALRPETTPSLVRMVAACAQSLPRPIKWFTIGEQFRFERPQKGRLRSFYQINCDCLGIPGIAADAEIIALCIHLFEAFGLTSRDIMVRISDRTLWMELIKAQGVQEESLAEVLSIIDKIEREDRAKIQEKLAAYCTDAGAALERIEAIVGLKTFEQLEAWISHRFASNEKLMARVADWRALFGSLKALGFADFIQMDLSIVRGLAYYTGFVFEVFTRETQSRALAGGGRYDNLVEKLGGPDLPAVGFAIGDVTLTDLLEEKDLIPTYFAAPDVFIVTSTPIARQVALPAVSTLRMQGIRVEYALREDMSLTKQLKQASQSQARWILVYDEERLVASGEVELRDRVRGTNAVFPKEHVAGVMPEVLRAFGSGEDKGGGCCGGGCGSKSEEDSGSGCCGGGGCGSHDQGHGGCGSHGHLSHEEDEGCGRPDCGKGACGSDSCSSHQDE